MRFKIWLETVITREEVRQIVLDALSGGGLTPEQQTQLLGSLVSEQPTLIQKLQSYPKIAPFMEKIQTFILTNKNANIMTLIDFIQKISQSGMFPT